MKLIKLTYYTLAFIPRWAWDALYLAGLARAEEQRR